ncbi:MAG: hypothetical protein COA77_04025 [Thaumarchaeota archaeon]|nr:MAG: hypothetical protein COA77_04025 [Nitrososphaerota archaeon]
MKSSVRFDLNLMWDKIDFRSKYDIWREGNQWGEQYLEELIHELVELKMKSKKEYDPMMYRHLNSSLTRAHEV